MAEAVTGGAVRLEGELYWSDVAHEGGHASLDGQDLIELFLDAIGAKSEKGSGCQSYIDFGRVAITIERLLEVERG